MSILQHAVKIVPDDSAENYIYPFLYIDLDSNASNHSLPCEVIRSQSQSTILVMPYVETALEFLFSASDFCDCVSQVLQVSQPSVVLIESRSFILS